jgi:hypothetical protein
MFARWVSATLMPRIEATSLVLLPSASRRTTSRSRVVRRSFSLFESSGRVPLGLFSSLVITSLAHGVKNGLCLASAGYALTHHRYRRRNDPVNAGRAFSGMLCVEATVTGTRRDSGSYSYVRCQQNLPNCSAILVVVRLGKSYSGPMSQLA